MSAGCWPSSACATGCKPWSSPTRPAWSGPAAAEGTGSSRLARRRAAQRPAERPGHRDGQQPPGVHRGGVHQQRGQRQGNGHHGGPAPVVADHEVVPERAEHAQPPAHAVLLSAAGTEARAAARARPSRAVYPSATRAVAGTMASSAASWPGHDAPAPSAPQNTPNEVSTTPTENFIVFSGTRDSGARTAIPTAATTTTAATAPAAASPTFCWLAPKVIAMNTTSRPSSSTPLNERVNAYQSRTPRRLPPVAVRAAAT